MTRRIVAVTAGLSTPSSTRLLTDQLITATRSAVGGRGEDLEVEVIELRELAVDLAQMMVSGGMASPALADARTRISSADGLIAVSPIFSASYSGLFKMFFDALDTDALNGMPVLIGATAGTERHSLALEHALRPLFAYLRAVVVPTAVFAATSDFGSQGGDGLTSRISRAASEFAALVVAEPVAVQGFAPSASDQRPRARTSGNGLGEVTPFASLLKGHSGAGN
ncbi:FMN reductase [Dermacoccaceae bacterium W4C1]